MNNPIDLPNIKNITVSGRIGVGATTVAVGLSQTLGWGLLEGGALFEEIHKDLNISELNVNKRPDEFDLEFEEHVKKVLREQENRIIQSHLAGFDAQGIPEIFKILVICEDNQGNDKPEIRIDRLVNRRKISIDEAKEEVLIREKENVEKWKRLYAKGKQDWVYWDKKYYDLVVNTYSYDKNEALKLALDAIGYKE
ncbi:MAG: hypothetical protein Q8P80_02185 [Candidatus Levybacteria bacterium]|nr:hypothetical protein [Candidatus Levybacteria bacterium]